MLDVNGWPIDVFSAIRFHNNFSHHSSGQQHETDTTPVHKHRLPNGGLITSVFFSEVRWIHRKTRKVITKFAMVGTWYITLFGRSFAHLHIPSHSRIHIYIPISYLCMFRVPDTYRRRVLIYTTNLECGGATFVFAFFPKQPRDVRRRRTNELFALHGIEK